MVCGSMAKDSSTSVVSDAAFGMTSASGAVTEVAAVASASLSNAFTTSGPSSLRYR